MKIIFTNTTNIFNHSIDFAIIEKFDLYWTIKCDLFLSDTSRC